MSCKIEFRISAIVIYGVQPLLVADWLPFSLPGRGFIPTKLTPIKGFV